jgi:hypothetical protein
MCTETTTNSTDALTTVKFAAVLVDGLIFIGKRHHNVFQTLFDCGYEPAESQKCPQGFVGSNGKFLTRTEAAKVALASGRITKLKHSTTELYSEDLY